MRNMVGDDMELCGTPAFMANRSEKVPFTATLNDLSLRKLENQMHSCVGNPRLDNLLRRPSSQTQSNALDMSKATVLDSPYFSTVVCQICET